MNRMRLEHVSELITWSLLRMNRVQMRQCRRKVASGRKVAGVIRPLVNARGLPLECANILHEASLMPVFIYGSKTICFRKDCSFFFF